MLVTSLNEAVILKWTQILFLLDPKTPQDEQGSQLDQCVDVEEGGGPEGPGGAVQGVPGEEHWIYILGQETVEMLIPTLK